MTVKQMKNLLKSQANAELTLFNSHKEKLYVGYATEAIPYERKIKFAWPLDKQSMDNNHPFTYAFIHDGKKILAGFSIKPLYRDNDSTKIELVYDYE